MSVDHAGSRRRFALDPLTAAVAATLAASALPAHADQQLRDTVVTATRSAAAIDDLPVTVTAVKHTATITRAPDANEVPFPIEVQHVVEYYAIRL